MTSKPDFGPHSVHPGVSRRKKRRRWRRVRRWLRAQLRAQKERWEAWA